MLQVVVPTFLRVLHARYRHCVLLRSGFWAQSLSRVHVPVIDQLVTVFVTQLVTSLT